MAALVAGAQAFPAAAHRNDDIHIRSVARSGDLLTFLADRDGLFRRFGKVVRVDYARGGEANMEALRAGEVDFALMPMTPYVLDLLADPTPGQADDPVILANLSHGVPTRRVAMLCDDPDIGAEALQGKVIGLERGSEAEYFWSMFAVHHGLDPAHPSVVNMRDMELTDALLEGRVDAVVLDATRLSRVRPPEGKHLRVFADDLMQSERWLLVTRRDVLAARPFSVAGVVRAYAAAADLVQRAPDAAIRAYAHDWGISDAGQADLRERTIYDVTLDWATYSSFRQQIDWARRAGYPNAGTDAGFLAAVAPQMLQSVAPDGVMLWHLEKPSQASR